MINHVTIATNNIEQEKAFYEAALAPLGYVKGAEFPGAVMFADASDADSVWVSAPKEGVTPAPGHFAFTASSQQAVDDFYAAGMSKGGTDNGKPGPRPSSGSSRYAAFVHDPDGNNIEAVFSE